MTDKPERPSDERSEPYYIDNDCPDCGTALELFDPDAESVWYDEWECPNCQDGIHMDWPEEKMDNLLERARNTPSEKFEKLDE